MQLRPLLAAAAALALLAPRSLSADPAEPAAGAVAADAEAAGADATWEAQRDARGWHLRQAPLDPLAVLAPGQPQPLELPPEIAARIQRRTVLIYISPACPHCVAVVPELVALHAHIADVADVLAVFSGLAKRSAIETFATEQKLPFPWVHDLDQAFATATGLDSTPSLLVVDPPAPPPPPVKGRKAPKPVTAVTVLDAYMPYTHGGDAILELRLRGAAEPVLGRGAWLGGVTCAACHVEEARSWSANAHAIAFYHLVEGGGQDDASCLGCHTTHALPGAWIPGQADQPAGYRKGALRSPFASVTCEACHGASGPHDGAPGDPKAACTGCHAPDHVPFDPVRGLALIDHFAGGALSDTEIQSWRSLVALGEQERPLIEPARGPSTGAAACARCHKDQARQWRKTPHARAMGQLEAKGADDPGCVVCHATPRDSSVPAADVAAFRTDESVGCELCHGQGAAHAADPAAHPLQSLKTRAPACFVAGVCERCHNEIRDEDFDLETALPLVAH